jgi:predicted DsbA family dithiol-disulfide isomerase
MKVEIWSDIMCPFCYIGKRRFEKALEQFPYRDEVTITWKSFQLNPAMRTEPGKNINEYLAEIKGWSIDYARQMNERVTDMAAEEGLLYDFDKAVVANSFDAHRLLQLAKVNDKGDVMEEYLFRAYFTEGKNIADHATLLQLGIEAGFDEKLINDLLQSNEYADKVQLDIYESQQIGVRGVPFFLVNDRYAVSGAQHVETFLSALNKAWTSEKEAAGNFPTGNEK